MAAGVNPSYSFLIQRAACKATSVGGSSVPSTNPPEEKNERNFSTRHCSLRPTPHITKYWQAAACPRELPKNRRRTEVSALYSGSPGAVGRHNNTPNRVAFGCGCPKHPASGACPHSRGARSHSSKCDNHGSSFNPAGTLAHASLSRRCRRRCRDDDSWLTGRTVSALHPLQGKIRCCR